MNPLEKFHRRPVKLTNDQLIAHRKIIDCRAADLLIAQAKVFSSDGDSSAIIIESLDPHGAVAVDLWWDRRERPGYWALPYESKGVRVEANPRITGVKIRYTDGQILRFLCNNAQLPVENGIQAAVSQAVHQADYRHLAVNRRLRVLFSSEYSK